LRNKGVSRRDNRLSGREIDIAITPLEHDVLTYGQVCKLFIGFTRLFYIVKHYHVSQPVDCYRISFAFLVFFKQFLKMIHR